MGIRARLLLLVLVPVIPALVLALYTNLEQRRLGGFKVEKDAMAAVQLAAASQFGLIEAARQHLAALSHLPQARSTNVAVFDAFFANMLKVYTDYTDFGLIETNGELVSCSLGRKGLTNHTDRAHFRRVLQTKDFAIGNSETGEGVTKPGLFFGHPVFDEKGRLSRVLYAALDLAVLNRVAAQAQLPEGGVISILDRGGHILAHHPEGQKWVGKSFPKSPLVTAMMTRMEGTSQVRGLDDVVRLYAFTTIRDGQIGNLFVSVGVPTSLAFAETKHLLVRNVTILIMVAALALVGAWVYANSNILHPIKALAAAATQVAAGDLTARTGIVRASSELNQLARTFDAMAAGLQQQAKQSERSEKALRQSEERTHLIVETALDAAINADAAGVITGWNPQAETIFGWTQKEAAGRSLAETIIPVRYRESHRLGLQRYLATGESVVLNKRIEIVALHRDGHEFPVELAITPIRIGDVVSFSAFVRDITERKQAEERLRTQLQRLGLLDQITRSINQHQDLDSIFQVVVQRLEDQMPIDFGCVCLYDCSAENLTVTSIGIKSQPLALELALPKQTRIKIDPNGLSRCVHGQLMHEADISQVNYPFLQRLTRGGLRSLVLAPLLVEGNVFGVLVTARRESNGFSSGDCEFLRQLSEHVALAAHQAQLHSALQQSYDDLRQTQQLVMQQERLRAIGQMASGVAHDINNAISPVALYVESLLQKEPNLTSRAREYLEITERAINDVSQTVSRMREFCRQREPQLTLAPVDLNRLVQQVIDLTRVRWSDMPQQRGFVIELVTEFAPNLPALMGVESEIREALTNLIFNAADAMPEGGTLLLRTRIVAGRQRSAETPAPPQICVEVVDTGVGMDEDTKSRCLEPFFTTKGERGTGLGLATVYGVVQRHSAEIEIETALGKGTTVRLRFPMPTTSISQPGQHVTLATVPSRLRILIVDDDPMVLQSLRKTLEMDNQVIVTAGGGQEGVEAFRVARDRKESFSVVITDLGMPYMDGRKVASAVKALSPSTPVILLTGWGQRLGGEEDIPPHVDHVLSKPPKLEQLREALANCCQPGSPSALEPQSSYIRRGLS